MRNLLLHWVFNAIALWVAAYFITGLDFTGTVVQLILVVHQPALTASQRARAFSKAKGPM